MIMKIEKIPMGEDYLAPPGYTTDSVQKGEENGQTVFYALLIKEQKIKPGPPMPNRPGSPMLTH